MGTDQQTEDRLAELELQLQLELAALRGQWSDNATPTFRSLRDELPPHY